MFGYSDGHDVNEPPVFDTVILVKEQEWKKYQLVKVQQQTQGKHS